MSRIFDSLLISKFRGIQNLELSDLGQVNILVGPNNSGKTSVVEAVSLLCKPFDPIGRMTVSQWRLGRRPGSVYPRLEAMKWLFPHRANVSFGGQSQEIELSTTGPSSIHLIARGVEIQGEDVGRPARNLVRDAIGLSESGYAVNSIASAYLAAIAARAITLRRWKHEAAFDYFVMATGSFTALSLNRRRFQLKFF